jgi:hypothetical protein
MSGPGSVSMRKIQDKSTGLYLSAPDRWVARIEEATNWPSMTDAMQAIRMAAIAETSCRIYLQFQDRRYNMALDL